MFQKFLFGMLCNCLAAASPAIVEGIRQGVEKMVVKAGETPNPWDDILMALLQGIVGKPKAPVETESESDGM